MATLLLFLLMLRLLLLLLGIFGDTELLFGPAILPSKRARSFEALLGNFTAVADGT